MPTEDIQLVHAIPGRLRLRVPALKADAALAQRIEAGLPMAPGVRRAQVNRQTGGLIVEYDPEQYQSPADLLALGRAFPGLLEGIDLDRLEQQVAAFVDHREAEPSPGQAINDLFASWNQQVKAATGGMDLPLLVPLALLVFGVRGFFISERAFPAWYDYFWFAFSSYFLLNRERPGARESSKRA